LRAGDPMLQGKKSRPDETAKPREFTAHWQWTRYMLIRRMAP
jgi:hypothetical protein